MHRKHSRTALIAALGISAILLLGAGSSCSDDSGQGQGEGGTSTGHILKACDTTITYQPRRPPNTHSRTIEAQTHSYCSPAPRAHLILITIQYHPNIKNAPYVTMGTKYCDAKPVPGIDTDCHVALPGVCHIGVWRMRVQITGTGPNGNPFALVLPNDRTVKIKSCS